MAGEDGADHGWKRIFRSEQGSEIIDEQSVTEYKIPTYGASSSSSKSYVRVMVNILPTEEEIEIPEGGDDNATVGDLSEEEQEVHFTIDFRKPELRCDEPEFAVLGKLEPGEPFHADRPVCYRVNIVQGNMRGDGIKLTASFTGDRKSLKPMVVYSSPADMNQWTPMESTAAQSQLSRTFSAPTSKTMKELDIMIVSKSKAESQYMVMFDTEAPTQHITESKVTCNSGIEAAPFGHAVQTSLHPLESRCFNFTIGKQEELFDAVRITIRCEEPVVTHSKTSVVEHSKKPSTAKKGGLLGLLEHLKQQFEGQEQHDWEEGDKQAKKAFWTPIMETAHSNSLHIYRYNLVHAFQAMSVDKEVKVATSLLPQKDLTTALTGASIPASIRFDLASPRCSFPTRVALGVKQVGFVVGGESPATACYFVALTKEQMKHSDRLVLNISPPSAAASMNVFVESHQSKGDDMLSAPVVTADTAKFQYCAARVVDHAVAPCMRKSMDPDQMENILLRVTLVADIATRVSYSLSFETNGPSCNFPVAADHTGDYEYRLSISNKMHQCYQLEPPIVKKKMSTGIMSVIQSGKASEALKVTTKYYSVHIELEDPSQSAVLPLLRVYSKGSSRDQWQQLKPHLTDDHEAIFRMQYSAAPAALGRRPILDSEVGAIGDKKEASASPLGGVSNILKKRLETLQGEMGGPSWITVTVLSGELVNFRIWFSDEEGKLGHAPEDEASSGVLSIVVAAIIICFAGVIFVFVFCFKGAEHVEYQRLDKSGAGVHGTGMGLAPMDEDEVDVEMDSLDPSPVRAEEDVALDEELEEVDIGGDLEEEDDGI